MAWPDEGLEYSEYVWRVTPGVMINSEPIQQGPPSSLGSFSIYPSVLSRVKHTHRLIVGTATDAVTKFEFYNDQGQLSGFDVELITWVCERLGDQIGSQAKIKFIPYDMPFVDLLPKLKNHDVDVVISVMSATKKREKDFGIKFSASYYGPEQVLIAKAGRNLSFGDLGNRVVGVERDTTNEYAADYLKGRLGFKIDNQYGSYDQVYQALVSEKIDFGLVDNLPLGGPEKEQAIKRVRNLGELLREFYKSEFSGGEYNFAIAVNDDDLLARINKILASPEGLDVLSRLEQKWGLSRGRFAESKSEIMRLARLLPQLQMFEP